MATTTDLPSGLLRRSDPVAYLVRSFQTNARIRSLTTGTFNRVVKDRIAFRLSGANSGLDGLAWGEPQKRIRLSSKPFNHTVRQISGQPPERTGFPDDFHIRKNGSKPRATVWGLPPGLENKSRSRLIFGARAAEDRKLRKDPFGGPCFEGTLRKAATATFPNHIPWPG